MVRRIISDYNTVRNFHIIYEINLWTLNVGNKCTLLTLFILCCAVRLTKNQCSEKYFYSWYGIGFDTCGTFSFCHIVVSLIKMFRVDNSSYVHVGNRKKDILIHGKATTERLADTNLTADAEYSINFSE